MMKILYLIRRVVLLAVSTTAALGLAQNPVPAPLNEPARVAVAGNTLSVEYDGQTLFTATISHAPADYYFREVKDEVDGAWHHSFSLTSTNGKEIRVEGVILASGQSFPCEENRSNGSTFVRHSFGLSHSLLNKAVYDRKKDWVFSVEQAKVIIQPLGESPSGNTYTVEVKGNEVVFLFKPLYYQKHRGLRYYEPWTYDVWKESVAGWCSWFAFFDKVTEDDIKTTTDVLAGTLKPYGLEYIQIDDGYQQETSMPGKWTVANNKFPGGMDGLAKYIAAKGLKPGIWTNVAFTNKEFVADNKSLFVTDKHNEPVKGRWIGYVMDGSNPETLNRLVKPVYKTFKEGGWKYYKLDALRHLLYEGYNSNTAYFETKKTERVEAFRNVVKAVRGEIGEESFLLACWGIRPELIGLVDGCRIGTDGFGLRTLTQYNSFNNVVWRNDPDHIELTGQGAYPACMVTSMTGSLFMLTDRAPVYHTPVVEAAKRAIPVLFTLPGQLYDIDPSCSMYLDRVGSQLSGSGPRIFDARYASPYTHFLLEINKPYENWMLLGRTDESRSHISFAEIGLDQDKEYLVFEFWTKQLIGSFKEGFDLGSIDTAYNCQLFCIREKQDHPQLLATGRHISCGGLELDSLQWTGSTLSGTSRLVENDSYVIYLYEPPGSGFREFTCGDATLLENNLSGNIRSIAILSDRNTTVTWKVQYR
jgi:alpha-galactosidase